jgi:RecA-family ATPase
MANTLPETPTANNPFRRFWDLGFHRLVPVIPPGVEIADKSSIAARMRAGEDPRGKAPGIRHSDGRWAGLHFVAMESQEADLDTWFGMGASVGVKTGQGLIAIDIDTTDKLAATAIYEMAQTHLGEACVRFGRSPKCLMLYQAPEDTPYRKVSFSTDTEERAAVEMLTEGRQFVAVGTHPGTGRPYRWHKDVLPKRDELTKVTHADLDAFFRAVADKLPQAKLHASADDRQAPDQETLQAPSFERLEQLVQAMPNTSAMFPDRESYVKVAYAIRGATPDGHDLAAQDLFLDWCAKWQGPDGETNDPDIALADWHRAKPPYRTGVRFLERHAVGLFFDVVEPDDVDDMFAHTDTKPEQRQLTFRPVSFFATRPVPSRDWVVPNLVPCKTVTLLTGDGGTGKSLLALQLAASVALGRDWLGNEVKQGPVLIISAEDDEDELHRRFEAVFRSLDAAMADVDNLRFISLAGEDAVLGALQGERILPTQLFKMVEQEIADTKPVLVGYDTLADLFGGNEINRTQTRQFIGLLRGLSVRHDNAGLLLGHPSVAGMQSGAGTSGSTAWSNSVRSRLYLERIQEGGHEPNPDLRRLTTKKSNYGPVGAQIGLKYVRGVFQVEDTAVTSATGAGAAKVQAAFLQALEQFNLQGRAVSSKAGANYAPKLFAEAGGAGYTKQAYQTAMNALFAANALKLVTEGRPGKERARLVACTPEERGFPPDTDPFE